MKRRECFIKKSFRDWYGINAAIIKGRKEVVVVIFLESS
jgi:hypothetical protein